MGARTRTRDLKFVSAGTAIGTNGYNVSGYAGSISRETNADVTMSPPYVVDHPLTITKRSAVPLRINGVIPYNPSSPGGATVEYTDYNPANRSNWVYTPAVPSFNSNYWKTKALANINPTRPKVDLPLFIWELKDLPRMIKGLGEIHKLIQLSPRKWYRSNIEYADVYLQYQFGWAPLVSDLLELFRFTEAVEDRMAQLRKLEHGTMIRRKLYDGESSNVLLSDYTLVGPYRNLAQWTRRQTMRERIWFTANGKLLDPLPNTDAGLRSLSEQIVLGLHFEPWRVWDFVPWTWLIDYFANMGDYLEATSALTRLKVTRMSLMATQTISSTLEPKWIELPLKASHSELSTRVRRRYVYANPHPTWAWTPFLTGRQMSILGALTVVSGKRRRT